MSFSEFFWFVFSAFWLNTERCYGKSESGKIRTRKLRIRTLFTQWNSTTFYLFLTKVWNQIWNKQDEIKHKTMLWWTWSWNLCHWDNLWQFISILSVLFSCYENRLVSSCEVFHFSFCFCWQTEFQYSVELKTKLW